MSLKLRPNHRVFVFKEYTDMRAGFDKLSMLVRDKLNAKIVNGDLFLFIGKTRKRIKGICYDGTGLILIAKKFETGKFMRLDDLENEELTVEELDWLMCGSIVRKRKFGDDLRLKKKGTKNKSFTYRPDGKLTSFTESSGKFKIQNVTYQYDPLGRRISKIILTGGTSTHDYDATHPIQQTFIHLGLEDKVLQAKAGNGVITTYLDGQSIDEHFGHANKNQTVGRFITKDPIGLNGGDLNLYRYLANNPLSRTDPSGLIWVNIGSAIFSGTASAILGGDSTDIALSAALGFINPAGGLGYAVLGQTIGHIVNPPEAGKDSDMTIKPLPADIQKLIDQSRAASPMNNAPIINQNADVLQIKASCGN